jgi:riboflavin synthase
VFSGIVEEIGAVSAVSGSGLSIKAESVLADLKPGDSVTINGVCLTATAIKGKIFTVNVMPETLRRSNLGALKAGDAVNLERALTLSGRLGGHLVQGHVDATGAVDRIEMEGGAELMTVAAPPEVMRYIVEKGFIAVDGLSLTVVERTAGTFTVSLVAYSREHTTMGQKKPGDRLNLEADIIAKYVENFVSKRGPSLNESFLAEHGFIS